MWGKRWFFSGLLAIAAVVFIYAPAAADPVPTGERTLGQTIMEPAYNDLNGSIVYLLTPLRPPVNATSSNVAPLYVPVYPTSAAAVIGTVVCQHQPVDNCPDHGPGVAGLAESTVPSVYGAGVWGHDHLLSAPPAGPPTGGDFNVLWEPVVVLFTNSAAAKTHIVTLSQLNAAIAAGNVIEIPLPSLTFYCSVVPASVYNLGTPVTPVPGVP